MKKILLVLLTTFTTSLFAQGGSGCIVEKFGKEYKWDKKDKKYLENTCNTDMYVFWCQDGSGKSKDAICGTKKKYYRQFWIVKPGQKKFNKFTIPPDARVKVGACQSSPLYKGQKSVKKFYPDGTYECAVNGVKALAKNEIAIPCTEEKTKYFQIQGVFGPKKNVLKVLDLKNGVKYTINTRNMNDKQLHAYLCEEPVANTPSILSKLKGYIRNMCKEDPEICKENNKRPAGASGSQGVRG